MSQSQPETLQVIIQKVDEAEMDEMWSFVGNKGQQRWLWHAIDHQTGAVLAYVLGEHKDTLLPMLSYLHHGMMLSNSASQRGYQ